VFYFLKEDFKKLNTEIGIISQKIKEAKKGIGESCKDNADTWHDNFGFEENQRQYTMWSNQLKELSYINANARIITPDFSSDKVGIGRTVTIQDEESGIIKTFKIGSYVVLGSRDRISYESPLAILLINGKVGERKKGIIGRKIKIFKILKIE